MCLVEECDCRPAGNSKVELREEQLVVEQTHQRRLHHSSYRQNTATNTQATLVSENHHGRGGGYLFFLSYNSDPSTTANCSSVSYFWQKRGENTTFTQREAKGGSMPLHGSTKIWRTEGQNVKVFTLLEKQSYILGHFFQLHTGSSDIIIMRIHKHHPSASQG